MERKASVVPRRGGRLRGGVSGGLCGGGCSGCPRRPPAGLSPPHTARLSRRWAPRKPLCASPPPRRPPRRLVRRPPRRGKAVPLAVARPYVGGQFGGHSVLPGLSPRGLEPSSDGDFSVDSLPLGGCHCGQRFGWEVVGLQAFGACSSG